MSELRHLSGEPFTPREQQPDDDPYEAVVVMDSEGQKRNTPAYFPGTRNPGADLLPRIDRTWSDGNLHDREPRRAAFERLVCRACGGCAFEVLSVPDAYETIAHCPCGYYYSVHCG